MTLLATLLTLLKIISAILLLKPVLITLSVIAGLILIYNIVVLLAKLSPIVLKNTLAIKKPNTQQSSKIEGAFCGGLGYNKNDYDEMQKVLPTLLSATVTDSMSVSEGSISKFTFNGVVAKMTDTYMKQVIDNEEKIQQEYDFVGYSLGASFIFGMLLEGDTMEQLYKKKDIINIYIVNTFSTSFTTAVHQFPALAYARYIAQDDRLTLGWLNISNLNMVKKLSEKFAVISQNNKSLKLNLKIIYHSDDNVIGKKALGSSKIEHTALKGFNLKSHKRDEWGCDGEDFPSLYEGGPAYTHMVHPNDLMLESLKAYNSQ